MRASPAFQITLQSFDVWRLAVCTVAVLSMLVLVIWISTIFVAWDVFSVGFLVVLVCFLVWFSTSLLQTPSVALRWDGQLWHLGQVPLPVDQWVPGNLVPTLDLGFWMLLRFTPVTWLKHQGVQWLPVQRRGLELHWHGLRCSVYSPRPALNPKRVDAEIES
jgi:hypothetical protein